MNIISAVKDLLLIIESKKKLEAELKEMISKLKVQTKDLDLSNLNECSYEECRDLFKQIQYYTDEDMLNELSKITEKKKVEKYPELLKPTYYPEIDKLRITDSEKIRLDKASRWNIGNYISKNNIKRLTYSLSIDDLELLRSVGVVEKKYKFRCKNCRSLCDIISESDLEKYKRFWNLCEFEKQKRITDEQLGELDQLERDGFYRIYLCCLDGEECDDIEITNEKELLDYMNNNAEVVYKVVKNPDLTYERL